MVDSRAVHPARSTASTTTSWSAISPSPIRPATSSATSGARKRPTARAASNLIGVKSPAIDKLIDHVIFAKDRAELVAATNALDRALHVERLRGAAMVLAECAHRLLGPLWPAQDAAGPDARLLAGLVVRRDAGRPVAGTVEALMAHGPRPWQSIAGGAALVLARPLAPAPPRKAKHGLSAFGDLAYPADFQHFAYANPDAPKGGTFSLVGWGGVTTFNSLNNYILKGDAAQGLELLFDSLMVPAADEPDAVYGLVAESAEVADDGKSVTFYLRPEAKFADGTPLTADDVVFSFDTLKTKGHPIYHQTLQDVVKAEALDPHTVRYTFTGELVRDLPLTVADAADLLQGLLREPAIRETTLDAPLGSGPYLVDQVSRKGAPSSIGAIPTIGPRTCRSIAGAGTSTRSASNISATARRRWRRSRPAPTTSARSSPPRSGRRNMTFPAIRAGKVKKEVLPTRRRRARKASSSIRGARQVQGPTRARGPRSCLRFRVDQPQHVLRALHPHAELLRELADEGRGRAVRGGARAAEPVSACRSPARRLGAATCRRRATAPARTATLLLKAGKLLDEAGWTVKNGVRVNGKGEPLKLEILMFEPAFERVAAPYVKNLKLLGIDATHPHGRSGAISAAAQGFRFRHHHRTLHMRNTPGVELRSYFGSAGREDGWLAQSGRHLRSGRRRADRAGDRRQEPRGAEYRGRALDRVLRAGHYWVPHWYKASNNIAYWDKFSRPATKPRFDRGILDTWWYDEAKAAKLTANAASSPEAQAEPKSRHPWVIIAALIGLALAVYLFVRRRRSARTQ